MSERHGKGIQVNPVCACLVFCHLKAGVVRERLIIYLPALRRTKALYTEMVSEPVCGVPSLK